MLPAPQAAPALPASALEALERRLACPGADRLALVGRTPIQVLARVCPASEGATLLAKLECRNPGGSVKDRTALGMVLEAEESGRLPPRGLIVEPTAGNTGIGLAFVGRALDHDVIVVMPERYSYEKARVACLMGAQVVRVPGPRVGMRECRDVARAIAERENGTVLDQFDNPANPAVHELTTGPEMWSGAGPVDAVVLGVGTGGTLTGVVRFLRRHLPGLRAHAVVPRGSLLGGGMPGTSRLEGIGGSFLPATLDMSLVTEVLVVDDDEAFAMTRRLAREEGILAGPSSGAAVAAAVRVARDLGPGRRVLTLIPDVGDRYWSRGLDDTDVAGTPPPSCPTEHG